MRVLKCRDEYQLVLFGSTMPLIRWHWRDGIAGRSTLNPIGQCCCMVNVLGVAQPSLSGLHNQVLTR